MKKKETLQLHLVFFYFTCVQKYFINKKMKPYGCQKIHVIYILFTLNLSNPFYLTTKSRLTLI